MWPFRRKKEKTKMRKVVKNVIAGVIIGAAISSIIGKKVIDSDKDDEGEE